MKNIVLVGFMGTGKTAVAKRLAARRGMKYVSTDEMIEKREKKSINDIFTQDGEPYFRKVESEVAKEASGMKDVVIDTGGGVVLREENIKNLKLSGIMICLEAQPEAILERTKKYKHRPLLNVKEPTLKIKELLELREPYYKKADYCIDTSGKSVDEVVDEIESKI